MAMCPIESCFGRGWTASFGQSGQPRLQKTQLFSYSTATRYSDLHFFVISYGDGSAKHNCQHNALAESTLRSQPLLKLDDHMASVQMTRAREPQDTDPGRKKKQTL